MVGKLHKRKERYLARGRERNRSCRFKTFASEEAAKKYAEGLGLKDFKIRRTRCGLGKKFKVILE